MKAVLTLLMITVTQFSFASGSLTLTIDGRTQTYTHEFTQGNNEQIKRNYNGYPRIGELFESFTSEQINHYMDSVDVYRSLVAAITDCVNNREGVLLNDKHVVCSGTEADQMREAFQRLAVNSDRASVLRSEGILTVPFIAEFIWIKNMSGYIRGGEAVDRPWIHFAENDPIHRSGLARIIRCDQEGWFRAGNCHVYY